MPGIRLRMPSSQTASTPPSGSDSTPPMPTMSADSQSTSATTRRREKPSARSAAISPSRWFTDTVSSTVMSSSANDSGHRRQHRRDLAEVGEAALLDAADHLLVGERLRSGAERGDRGRGGGRCRRWTSPGSCWPTARSSSPQARARLSAMRRRLRRLGGVEREVGDAGHAKRDRRERSSSAAHDARTSSDVARLDAEQSGRRLADHDLRAARPALSPKADRSRGGSSRDACRCRRRPGTRPSVRVPRRSRLALGDPERQRRSDRGQRGDASGGRGRVGHQRSGARPVGGADADVEAGAVEQIAHRDDEAVRQQQHVEEQRADGGDAEHAERRRAPAGARGCATRRPMARRALEPRVIGGRAAARCAGAAPTTRRRSPPRRAARRSPGRARPRRA